MNWRNTASLKSNHLKVLWKYLCYVFFIWQKALMQEREKEIFKYKHYFFHTECDCNMYTTVYKALFQSYFCHKCFDWSTTSGRSPLISTEHFKLFSPSAPNPLEVVWHHMKQNLGTLFSVCFDFYCLVLQQGKYQSINWN